MLIDIIIGARPNFIKAFPIIETLKKNKNIKFRVIHTGQHYDDKMSKIFFDEFNFNNLIEYLGGKNMNPIQFISKTINLYYKKIKSRTPNLCVLFGDVNSTLAIAIACNKLNIPIAHVEAGLRSFDKTMPEEHNRVITDHLSSLLFVTTYNAKKNLLKENIDKSKIFLVGNIMIESLIKNEKNFKKNNFQKKYIVLTIHRPSNTSNMNLLSKYLKVIETSLSENTEAIFPVHHSVKKKINFKKYKKIKFTDPMSYFNFISIIKSSIGLITDSGGITEETTYMNIPCITLRPNTERPETVTHGTNIIIGSNLEKLSSLIKKMDKGIWKKSKKIKFWDDKVSGRIVNIIKSKLNDKKFF